MSNIATMPNTRLMNNKFIRVKKMMEQAGSKALARTNTDKARD